MAASSRQEEPKMSAYFIVFVEKPMDQSEIDAYVKKAGPSLQGRDVKFHTRPGSEIVTLEGDEVDSVIVFEFNSVHDAKDWYNSPLYQSGLKHRLGTARSRAVIVEKLPV
jgi:uncharacterized protein (DUF1330 family)